MKSRLIVLLALTLILLSSCSLAEDITPPPNYQSPTPAPTMTSSVPIVTPEAPVATLAAAEAGAASPEGTPAATPAEAIQIVQSHGGPIHLDITDVVMPEMNGRDLARELQSLYPHIKLLFTSGYTADIIANHGILIEGVHFIQKPYAPQSLTAKIREVLDQA